METTPPAPPLRSSAIPMCGVEDAAAAGKRYFAAERESSARSGFAQGNPIRD